MRQPVITGLGIVSPIGIGVDAFWTNALAGRSGIGRPTLFDASKLPPECQIVGEIPDFDARDWMPGPTARMAGRFTQFAVAAARMARDDSALDEARVPGTRLRVAIGTSLNGQTDVEQQSLESFQAGTAIAPWTCLEYPAHAASSHVGIELGAQGQTATIATACGAGLDAIAWAAQGVRDGSATAAVAGGTDAPLSPFILSVFQAVGVLSKWDGPPEEASRPFDALRSGLVLAEGAATVVVEDEEHARARHAPIYARVLATAHRTEGTHLRKVDETGGIVSAVITDAIHASGLSPTDIDFVCAHGNSMPDYDTAETAGIKRALGRHAWNVPVSSLKSMCGQALSAAGAIQVVGSCLALRDQRVPPTINYRVRDRNCDLDYVPNRPRYVRLRHILIHAHSLGGSHIAMILAAP